MTNSYIKMKGEDERFKDTCLRIPQGAFSHRPHQIAPAEEIARVHMGFRYRIMMGANYKTKKALKESIGKALRYVETSMFGAEYKDDGTFCVVGPDPYIRKWYASVTMENGLIKKVS